MPRLKDDQVAQVVGRNIKAWRIKRGITQVKLATSTGVAHSTIVRIEAGAREATLTNLFRIAQALNIKPGSLLSIK